MAEKLHLPEWTEIGQDTGLDPLAMVRPTEALYQRLVPGISTITLRLRYYAFFPWLLEQYARTIGDTSLDTFRVFQRRAEALYALIGVSRIGPDDVYETGITGAIWASRTLSDGGDVYNFADAAAPDAEIRYLKNKAGAYGAIYAGQLGEMGLVRVADGHPIDIADERGRQVAAAFAESVRDQDALFLEVVERGIVTPDELERLSVFKSGRIPEGSEEQRLLRALLVGGFEKPLRTDEARKQTMLKLLELADQLGRRPRPEDAKWAWYNTETMPGVLKAGVGSLSLALWRLYHTNDLLRLAYEGMFKRALGVLASMPRRALTLTNLVEEVVAESELPGTSWAEFQIETTQGAADLGERDFEEAISRSGGQDGVIQPETLRAAVGLLAVVLSRAEDQSELIEHEFGPYGSTHFRSLASERRFIDDRASAPAADVLAAVLKERVIKRHLWVAARKLRTQRAYTYLADVTDGELRFRSSFAATLSNPRLEQSLTFLTDAGLLDADGLTPRGREALASA
ncbi:hypothetical protein L5876_07520 [Hyphobacterium sp. SN044]|uniref:hypothetical protein n=1 Tax=Hyphobacterium sp. SN044 TaxID=2912575 RepID=UPI001F23A13B|nr:hypothetical protein [Hyphobacterium sp. SN044]MCF8879657.1 hypothetical protein [Hyphobacterium sp. SN044]